MWKHGSSAMKKTNSPGKHCNQRQWQMPADHQERTANTCRTRRRSVRQPSTGLLCAIFSCAMIGRTVGSSRKDLGEIFQLSPGSARLNISPRQALSGAPLISTRQNDGHWRPSSSSTSEDQLSMRFGFGNATTRVELCTEPPPSESHSLQASRVFVEDRVIGHAAADFKWPAFSPSEGNGGSRYLAVWACNGGRQKVGRRCRVGLRLLDFFPF